MHNNYFFLRKLSAELEAVLKNCVLSECFSQNKDELIIRFETTSKPFFIKASLLSGFCCLSFPEQFNRARKNSVNLFAAIIGLRVLGVKQFDNERCFSLKLTDDFELLFKMHGNRSNLVLFHENKTVSLFRNHLQTDLQLEITNLDKEIDWSKEAFISNKENRKHHYFTFGKVLWRHLDSKTSDSESDELLWQEIQQLLKQLESPTYHITEIDLKPTLSLVPVGKIQATYTRAIQTVHEFFTAYSVQTSVVHERQLVLTKLTTHLKNAESYLKKTKRKLTDIEADDHYKLWADLIMANLHQIKPGMEKIIAQDFYHENKTIEVRLKKDLSAQKNAEVYYRKSKNHHIEIEKLEEAIERKKQEVKKLEEQIHQITEATDQKTVRNLAEEYNLVTNIAKNKITLPYHEIDFQGYKIWIGKNAKSNDTLTLKHTYKEDLWLHAKDVAGSHVVLKYQSGKKFPKEVIERAAQLAAYHSKRKTESLCPVAFTLKKYVRKRKGDPPGAIVVEREEVIMVEPIGI